MKYLSDRMLNRIFERFVWVGFLVLIWILTIWIGDFSPLILPSPDQVLNALFLGFTDGLLGRQILISILLVFFGMGVGILIAFLFLFDRFRLLVVILSFVVRCREPVFCSACSGCSECSAFTPSPIHVEKNRIGTPSQGYNLVQAHQ